MPSDPRFYRPSKGGRLEYKDYTKHIKWTPLKVAFAVMAVLVPYSAIVVIVAKSGAVVVALVMVFLVVLLAAIAAWIYWVANAKL